MSMRTSRTNRVPTTRAVAAETCIQHRARALPPAPITGNGYRRRLFHARVNKHSSGSLPNPTSDNADAK
jgi:hypothetical protein